MTEHQYFYVLSLYFGLTAFLAIAYGWQNLAVGCVLGIIVLLAVAIRREESLGGRKT